MDRIELLEGSINSVRRQNTPPAKLILVVDHNEELLKFCEHRWGAGEETFEIVIRPNQFGGRLGSARNTAVLHATSDIVAFLDDDAEADETWLSELLSAYEDPAVKAVGGAPLPLYGAQRPRWWPPECDWVFGCHYRGMPETRQPVRRLIGANMSAYREVLLDIGGFHADDHDDMDLSHRIAHRFGTESVVYEPKAIVRHFVSAQRLTWRYFWRRCYFVNRSKVGAFADMEDASNIDAELAFALRAVVAFGSAAWRIGNERDVAIQRAVALIAVALAGMGYIVGRIELLLGRRQEVLTTGLPRT